MSTPTTETNPVIAAIETVAPANSETTSANGILAAMEAFSNPAAPAAPEAPASETPPPAEPTPDTDPDLSDLPPNSTPEAKETWKTLKQTKKQLAEQLDAERKSLEAERKLRSELEERVKTTPAVDPDVEAKLKRVEELEKKIAMVDIEATEAYQQSVVVPAKAIETVVDQIVKSYDGDDAQVDAILHAFTETNLKARREKLSELTADMDPMDAAEIKGKALAFQELLAKRDQLKTDAVSALKEAKAQEERKREQMTAMERAAYRTSVSEAKTRLAAGLKDKFGESIVTALETAAESISGDKFEFSDPNVKAFAALSAAVLPTIVSTFTKQQAEIAELKATLGAYEKAAPKPGGLAAPASTAPEPIGGVNSSSDILSRMRQAVG
jgi:hypothetical protein